MDIKDLHSLGYGGTRPGGPRSNATPRQVARGALELAGFAPGVGGSVSGVAAEMLNEERTALSLAFAAGFGALGVVGDAGKFAAKGGSKILGKVVTRGNYGDWDKSQKLFLGLADAQRGAPEHAMLKVQHATGGGVLQPLVEHVGDLTHRMAEATALAGPDMGFEFVLPKVRRALHTLRHPYGFRKEMLENFASNARFNDVPLEEFQKKVTKTLQAYGKEHKKLKVYNEVQRQARDAAVALGDQDWYKAQKHLEFLEDILEQGPEAWAEAASKIE